MTVVTWLEVENKTKSSSGNKMRVLTLTSLLILVWSLKQDDLSHGLMRQ